MDNFTRTEVTHCDEVGRTATSSAQWFLENLNKAGSHAITHNNYLTFFICGQEGFADIAEQIGHARESIDLCCWGFDPGMELVRAGGATWPRGETYGDLLIAAGRRGVRVRLLVWYDGGAVHTANPCNMPGISHGTNPWRRGGGDTDKAARLISAQYSLKMLKAYRDSGSSRTQGRDERYQGARMGKAAIPADRIPLLAREEYCHSWYQAALQGRLDNIDICTHYVAGRDTARSFASETRPPAGLERAVMVHFGSHHQKPILIDFQYQQGCKAVGYVIGLNSVTDYWDTCAHRFEDARREQNGGKEKGMQSLKPFRDYACRIDGGGALVDLHNNFAAAWNRACDNRRLHMSPVSRSGKPDCAQVPAALLRKVEKSERRSSVQIVRTQAAEGDHSIRDIYFQVTKNATLAAGYMYLENQYFQYEEWAKRLMQTRRDVVAKWKKGAAKAGVSLAKMPVMHVFVVIPVPERPEMIPNTYDILARMGQQDGMTGQVKLINNANKQAAAANSAAAQRLPADELGRRVDRNVSLPEVVRHANAIDKPTVKMLEDQFGLKVSTAMLNVCGFDGRQWNYREIYIHSKLLLVDDVFITLGSANLNQRSMAGDSELNLATTDSRHASALRARIWSQLSGGMVSGDNGCGRAIAADFFKWSELMKTNREVKKKGKQMTGFLLPLEDDRSSTIRLG